MQVIEIASFGGPDVLRLAERPMPVAGLGELCIQVSASGVNRPDVLQRAGHYPAPPGASEIPGLEVAGSIVSGDLQAMVVAGLKIGDRVCALVAGGGYAEFCIAPVAQCLPVPKGLSDVEAASLPLIVTPVGAVPELIVDRVNGLIVPPEAQAVTEAVSRLRKYPAWAAGMAAEAKRFADREGHAVRMARDYEDLLERLWEEKHRSQPSP